nr:SAM-dependent methyltransferase [Tamaricihabitans halophyticus]
MSSARVDTTTASVARVYDRFLSGKDNYEVDRAVYEQVLQIAPQAPQIARDNRAWLIRVVRFLTNNAGINQFLDCGAGLPTAENTHEAAQRLNREARVIYMDNDPVVAAHGRALLEENDRTHLVMGDLTKPDEILSNPTVRKHLDFDQPLALMHCATMHHVPDSDGPRDIMKTYVDALPSGSYLALTHFHDPGEADPEGHELARFIEGVFANSSMGSGFFRSREEIESLFCGLPLVEPGLTNLNDWWPDGPRLGDVPPVDRVLLGALARKP